MTKSKFPVLTDIQIRDKITKCFIGCLIKRGNKRRGRRIYQDMLLILADHLTDRDPLNALQTVLMDLKPSVSIWKKRKGGSTVSLPYLISEERGLAIAIHALIKESNTLPFHHIAERLAHLVINALSGQPTGLEKKKNEIHKIAVLNRPFLYLK